MSAHTATPMKTKGTLVYLANRSGGFDLRGCPDPEELAAFIAMACNTHDSLVAEVARLQTSGSNIIKSEKERTAEVIRLRDVSDDLVKALEGVLRVADRATDEFDAARAALAKASA